MGGLCKVFGSLQLKSLHQILPVRCTSIPCSSIFLININGATHLEMSHSVAIIFIKIACIKIP